MEAHLKQTDSFEKDFWILYVKKTIYFIKSYPESLLWEKDVEVVDGKLVDETFWRISENKKDSWTSCWPINDSDELELIKYEINKIRNKVISGVSPKTKKELEQHIATLRQRKNELLFKK